jgi:peptidyl-prolyl cis-trans isomerase A (cyclophilin A)/peptidyl-prolyl cis-trans isomerase B (cyclophilin B)
MRTSPWRLLASALLLLNLSCALAANTPRVRVTTSMGQFVIELYPERAPLTVANFLRYVREGHYTDTLFHRVVGNFVIQGGGHAASDMHLKTSHDPVVNESGNGLPNKRGAVGLARSDSPHSGNAQFYVDISDNPDLDPVPTRWGYAVFGRVVEGMDVVDRIGAVATGPVGPFKTDAPLKPIVIQKVEEIDATASAPAPAAAPAAATGGSAPAGSAPASAPPSAAPPAAPSPPPQ